MLLKHSDRENEKGEPSSFVNEIIGLNILFNVTWDPFLSLKRKCH